MKNKFNININTALYIYVHSKHFFAKLVLHRSSIINKIVIDDFRGACAVKGNIQVAGRMSSVSTTEMLSTHDVTLRNVDGSLFHVQI